MAFVNEHDKRRTIDHARQAWLVCEGGTPERDLMRFSFHWKGESMEFYVTGKFIKEPHNQLPSIHWIFDQLNVPSALYGHEREIASMVKEALEAHGLFYGFEMVKAATAEDRYTEKIGKYQL